MSSKLTDGQNFSLGVVAAFIEGILLQPTLYWKNAKAQKLPFSIDPRIVYRGTAASIYNEMQMMGLQFGLTGLFKRFNTQELGRVGDYLSAFFGGSVSAIFASPVELVMIQQQREGGSILATIQRIASSHGTLMLFRGVAPAMVRDALYVSGFLGVTPLLQDYLMTHQKMQALEAGLCASLFGGIVAAVPSHPLDVIKTCMQGDLAKVKYTSMTSTAKALMREGGLRRIFSGCFWRSFNIVATVYIANECRLRLPIHMFGHEY
jgi:solute carrier family 25 (mitochondrial carnitine/acylcarnitine transporter), member 20/29